MINLDALPEIGLNDVKRALFNARTQPMAANDNPLAPGSSGKSSLEEVDKALPDRLIR